LIGTRPGDRPPFSPPLAAWRARGQRVRVFGHDVFALADGPPSGSPLLVLHGFPTCSLDYRHTLPILARSRRVVLHDHLGFGLSAKPEGYSYSLMEQAEVAIGVWRELGIERGHLLAHDYGTSVATELLARRERGLLPITLESVTLTNGSVYLELAKLTPSQKILSHRTLGPIFARMGSRRVFRAQIRRVFGRRDAVPDDELDLLYEALALERGRERLPAISGYLEERMRFRDRWIGALSRAGLPVHVLWGKRDPVAVPLIAERLAREVPGARLTWLEELGHYPMLEDPVQFAAAVTSFVDASS
jgi:pimeloyl-ACP methyl ester carboxylesterase